MIFSQDKPYYRPWYLLAMLPLYHFMKRFWPKWCAIPPDIPTDIYASGMLSKKNWLFHLIFPPFFKKIRFEITDENALSTAKREGTIVYITHEIGKLEYNYYQHLFDEVGLPIASFTNGISLRRWMPWPLLKATLITQIEAIEQQGGIPDPILSGSITELITQGKSVLLSLRSSELEEDSLLLSHSQSLLLTAIMAKRKTGQPIYFVPLDFIWDRRPAKAERTIIDILFGEKENPGRWRKLVLFWRNYRYRAIAKIGAPIDISTLLNERNEATNEVQARYICKRLHEVIHLERRTITGPPMRPKRWFIERVLIDETFQQTLCDLAASLQKPADDLRELASRYVKEIAADINTTYIELMAKLLRWSLKSLYSGLVFNEEGLLVAKRLYARAPIIFVPNHKSHVDYLLLSYVLYSNYMTIPHIAAGVNLSFWPLGPLFRGGGAYFIRRSFENNQLYRATVETYLKILLEESYSQEFFIEGGRSRTGKLLRPRYGMLHMFSKAVTSGAVPDIYFIPVSFTYDRVIEQKTYEEELKGGSKKKERPTQLFRLAKYLKHQKPLFGKIYVNFGKPVSFKEVAKQKGTDDIVEIVADDICYEINRNMVVTPQSIAAAALLSHSERGMTLRAIQERSSLYLNWLFSKHVQLSQAIIADPETAVEIALDQLVLNKIITKHEEALEPFYSVDEDKRLELDYFKNGCIHFLASISVLSTLLLKYAATETPFAAEEFLNDFKGCQNLLKYEFRFSARGSIIEHIQKIAHYLELKGALTTTTGNTYILSSKADSILVPFSNLLRNFFESIKIALAAMKNASYEKVDDKELVKTMLQTGKNLLLLGDIRLKESISKENFSNALRLLCHYGILRDHSAELGTKGAKIFSTTGNQQAYNNLKVQLERLI